MRHSLWSVGLFVAGSFALGGCGNAAEAERCGPTAVALVKGADAPTAIAVDDTNLYWATGDLILAATSPLVMKAPLLGGAPTVLVARKPAPEMPNTLTGNIEVAAGKLYFIGGGLMSVPISGGTPTLIASSAGSIDVDATSVYWSQGEALAKAPLAGGPSVMLVSGVSVNGLVVSAHNIVWSEQHLITNVADNIDWDEVHEVPLDGGMAKHIGGGMAGGRIQAFTADDANVYWADANGVQAAPIEGGATRVLSIGDVAAAAWAMAVDKSDLYVLGARFYAGAPYEEGQLQWSLKKISLDGGAAVTLAEGTSTTLATGGASPGLAMDDACVYWSDSGVSGNVFAIAK